MSSTVFNTSVIAKVERLLGPFPKRFDLEVGRRRWQKLRELDPSSPLLITPPGGSAGSVSLEACYLLAGRQFGFYTWQTALEGITTWVVPLLVLLGNVNFASLPQYKVWNQLSVVAHMLGNPIDALWGLLTKLDVERRIKHRCREVFRMEDVWIFQTILFALDDFEFSERFEENLEILRKAVIPPDEAPDEDRYKKAMKHCRRAAVDLATHRVNNTGRALLAILSYCAAVASKLILANSGADIPPHLSHTIALRAIMYWLGPMLILSAKAGGYPSEWTSVGILRDLEDRLDQRGGFAMQRLKPWNGGNYTWRPQKMWRKRDARSWFLFFLSVTSVAGAWATSFTISFRTPTRGLGARGVAELTFVLYWLLNSLAAEYCNRLLHHVAYRSNERSRRDQVLKRYWITMSCLNMAGTVGILTVLIGAFSGWWRNCHAWSAAPGLLNRAYFDFNMLETIKQSLRGEFLFVVGAGIIWQIIVALIMLRVRPIRCHSRGCWCRISMQSGRIENEAAGFYLADLDQARGAQRQ